MENGQNQSLKRIGFEDGIGRLPDFLLAEILSCLPETKYAIRTGALSKRWRHIWTTVPNLVFLNRQLTCSDFFAFVDKTLTQRPQFKLNKFILSTCYDGRLESQISNWIRYAVNCNVEELSLGLWDVKYTAQDELFFSSCFTYLGLSGCSLNPTGPISWKNLRSLCISRVKLDEGLIENILSGSPVLETLELNNCYDYTRLNITSKSVKNLVFDGRMGISDRLDNVEINAPNILSLTIKRLWWLNKFLLLNVSSLVEAHLDYLLYTTAEYAEEEMLKGFMLEIGTYCCQVLSRLKAMGFIDYPSNLKLSTDATR